MGVAISRIWSPSQHFEYDSTTGLTGEEKQLLTDNFNILKQDLSKAGERLFILYFQDFPDNQNYFKDFKDKNIEELKGSPKLIAHGASVMGALNSMIINLNNPATLVEIIKKVGYNHGRRNIKTQALVDLKTTILKFLQEKLKNKYNNHVADVWSKTIDIIAATYQSGMQEYMDDKNKE